MSCPGLFRPCALPSPCPLPSALLSPGTALTLCWAGTSSSALLAWRSSHEESPSAVPAWLVRQGRRALPPARAVRLMTLRAPSAACFPLPACSWCPLPPAPAWCRTPPPPALPPAAGPAAGASAAPLPATAGAPCPPSARMPAALADGVGRVAASLQRAPPVLSRGTGDAAVAAASGACRAYSASGSSQRSCSGQQAARQHRRPLDLLHSFRPIPVCFPWRHHPHLAGMRSKC